MKDYHKKEQRCGALLVVLHVVTARKELLS